MMFAVLMIAQAFFLKKKKKKKKGNQLCGWKLVKDQSNHSITIHKKKTLINMLYRKKRVCYEGRVKWLYNICIKFKKAYPLH
jgi:hypothetical protein